MLIYLFNFFKKRYFGIVVDIEIEMTSRINSPIKESKTYKDWYSGPPVGLPVEEYCQICFQRTTRVCIFDNCYQCDNGHTWSITNEYYVKHNPKCRH